MLGLTRVTTNTVFMLPIRSNSISHYLFITQCHKPRIRSVTRSFSTVKPSPGRTPMPTRGLSNRASIGVSVVALLGAIGMGGYYVYLDRKEKELRSAEREYGPKLALVEKERVSTPVTPDSGVKSDETKLPDSTANIETPIQVDIEGTTKSDVSDDVIKREESQITPDPLEDQSRVPTSEAETEQLLQAVTPQKEETQLKQDNEAQPRVTDSGKEVSDYVKQKDMSSYSHSKVEDILDSEFPDVHNNILPADSSDRKGKSKAMASFQKYLDTKDKFSENIHSQRMEIERVSQHPQDTVANESLDSLESLHAALRAEYNTAKYYALSDLRELGETDRRAATEYENQLSTADQKVSDALRTLDSAKSVSHRQDALESNKSKLSKLSSEIESLQSKLSHLRREGLEREADLEIKYNESLSSLEGETKKIMYQLIETHHDHMAARLTEHTGDLNKKWVHILEEWTEAESGKYQKEKSEILSRLKGISLGIDKSAGFVSEMKQFHLVLSLVNELKEFIDKREQSGPKKIFIKQRIVTLCEHLHEQPELISLLKQIPSVVLVHGLVSKPWIVERFRGLERSCWRLAYVDDEDKLSSYVKSYFRSFITFSGSSSLSIPDLEQLERSNATLLRYAHTCIQKGDLHTAARLMNNLTGVARREASHWVREVVSYLETEQVVRVLYWFLTARIVADAK